MQGEYFLKHKKGQKKAVYSLQIPEIFQYLTCFLFYKQVNMHKLVITKIYKTKIDDIHILF